MTRTPLRGALAVLAPVLAVVLLGSCAERPADDGGGAGAPPSSSPALPDGLVLQASYTGGFVTPGTLATRLPLVSVYSDGRVLSEGPVPAIYPGPALPNVQVAQVDEATVRSLVEQALAAGVAEDGDLGTPPIADAASTRFTLVTAEGTAVREVYALAESDGADGGLTDEQRQARAALSALLDALTAATGTSGEGYVPEALAVVARPWTDSLADPELPQPDVGWPGPQLPGEPLEPALDLSCLTVTGPDLAAVLQAAAGANAASPWVAADGSRWFLTFRPLLPSETSCADLAA